MQGYNYNQTVRDLLGVAAQDARRRQHEYIGTEHLLSALLTQKESVTVAVLQSLGVDGRTLQQQIDAVVKNGNVRDAGPHLPYTSRVVKVFELTMEEARELGHSELGAEHLLAGLLKEQRGIAAQLLIRAGVTIDAVRETLLREHAVRASTSEQSARETTQPRITSFAPQFLVDDLERSMNYYRKLGFVFGDPWDGFYAIGERDGLELHLKEAPKNQAERQHRREHEHLDAAAGVDGIETFYAQCVANGVTIIRSLTSTEWGTKDFYVEDPDGYIVSFGGRSSSADPSQ